MLLLSEKTIQKKIIAFTLVTFLFTLGIGEAVIGNSVHHFMFGRKKPDLIHAKKKNEESVTKLFKHKSNST